jgi:DnaJ-class molecular chaperone
MDRGGPDEAQRNLAQPFPISGKEATRTMKTGGKAMAPWSPEKGPERDPHEVDCPECQGRGQINGKTCSRCDGKGVILTRR